MTAPRPIRPTSPAVAPRGSLTQAEVPLIDAEVLFKDSGPPLITTFLIFPSWQDLPQTLAFAKPPPRPP
jgi:hypothetical protein